MTGQNNFPFIINIGNSIIGVTVLAMPFCFKACGIILGSLMLLLATWLTLVSCQLLLKAGITARRRSYSFLAYFTHGAIGKLVVEIGMIGLQIGTLVAQVVIIGDLGPAIISKFLGLQNTDNLRTGLIIVLCLFLGLPLGMLKDVRMLSNTSTMCIMFYSFFTFYIIIQSIPNLLKGQWYSKVTFWRWEGFFQCLPIYSFAFGCQTQMFIVYDALAEPSLKRMNNIVGSAVNMCAVAYLLVGFFGNVAFCNIEISGDIVNHFAQNSVSDGIKMCFVMSIAVSIPLIVFPCRVSLYNLLFPQKHKEDLPGSGKIPELHFRVITICIIVGAMCIGIMVPNVEFVLGLSGATMGSLICYIFPALFFLAVMASSSEGKWTARMTLICGLTILIASTYITLSAQEKKLEAVRAEDIVIPGDNKVPDIEKSAQKNVEKVIEQIKPVEDNKQDAGPGPPVAGVRQEPPNPQAPIDKQVPDDAKPKDIPDNIDKPIDKDKPVKDIKRDDTLVNKDGKDKDTKVEKDDQVLEKVGKKDGEKKQDGEKEKLGKDKVDKEIEEKEKEMAEKEKKQDEILGKLEQQQEEQQKLIDEQKQILEELKQHKEEHIEKEKVASENKDKVILQPVQQGEGQQLVNQQQGGQQAAQGQLNQQVVGQQLLQNQPVEGQQVVMNQPMAGQQVVNQPIGGQQQVLNQPVGVQQQVVNQPVGVQQQMLNQPIGDQQVVNQPMGVQQQAVNQPIGGQQVVNQPVGVQQQAVNQPIGGQQQVFNQPMGQQQLVQNQPVAQQQLMDGQNILQNQQGLQNQVIMGQQVLQNQPVLQPQAAAGQQQQLVNPNDLNAQNQQPAQQVPLQGLVAQPAVDAVGQLVGNVPVQNVPAENDGNIGLQNPQGQKPIVPAQQVGDPVNIKQDIVRQGAVNDVQQKVKPAKDHNIEIDIKNPAENVQNVGIQAEEGKGAIKDDALRRRKRDLGNDNIQEDVIPNQNQNNNNQILNDVDKVDKVIDKDETGGIQRDLRQIDEKVEPFGDTVDSMIKGVKKDLYLDGNRKSPFVVQMAETNLDVKRR